MAITLGTNIPSYNARVNLNSVTTKLANTMEKLSTGLKINRASDDAAGLVISQNMEALVRGSKQAQANIQNATSFLAIAEDGMVSIGDHLQRMNDLLVNMANDTNDVESRAAAVREIIERIDEINRLADSTNFNGRVMLGEKDPDEKIVIQMGCDETLSSVLDISPALTDCHTKILDVDLPAILNPDSKISGTNIIYPKKVTNDDGSTEIKYFKEAEDGTVSDSSETEYNNATGGSGFNATNENCRAYMKKVQDAISKLATCRGLIGAYENRMESSYDSMATRIESLEEAKSVYTDTDIAQEATNLSTQQIMQQYNVAILANANTLPQLALSLIGG
ncbi:MAG: flagellin [Candidatus Gastranaerophilales bacterium]|nr:flagellin [Candidatus Gastranaerophilales bacterium]